MLDNPFNADAALAAEEALLGNPRFPAGMWRLTERFLALHQGQIINKLTSTTARYYVTAFALVLHARRRPDDPASGLTLSRLQARCAAMDLLSPGQVRALVELMRQTGRLLPVENAPDKRLRLLRPGPLLVAEGRGRNALHLEALALIHPGRDHLRRLRDEPGFLWAMERARGALFDTVPVPEDRFAELAAMWRLDGGYMVMMALLAALRVDDAMPVAGLARLPFAETAQRFGIGRSQVRRCLATLQESGLLRVLEPGGQAIDVGQSFVDQLVRWHAMRLLRFEACAFAAEAQTAG